MIKDLNYFPLDVESNIYGMTKLEFEDMTSNLLVATLDCRLYCISYSKSFKPQTREVQFTYIPNGAKIISIGALKRAPNDFVIGITHSLSPSVSKATSSQPNYPIRDLTGDVSHANRQTTTYYFNIYASESRVLSSSFDLDHVAQGCQTIRLRYVPYHLYSTELLSYDSNSEQNISDTRGRCQRKPIWLLSGGDELIHAYIEDKINQSFTECPIEECLPELCDKQQSLALWIDVVNIENNSCRVNQNQVIAERAIALGFEDGSVRLYQSILTRHTNKYELVRASSYDAYTTIIPCVRLFKTNSMDLRNSRLRQLLELEDKKLNNPACDTGSNSESDQEHLNQLNLLVVSSTNESLIFRNVTSCGLDDRYELPFSKRLDCVTTATIGDTNADGYNEILLGSHNKELITYQYDASSKSYQLDNLDILNYPIFSLSMLDLTGDGLKDVTILLASGILVMQAVVKDVMELCRHRLKIVMSNLALR